MWPKEWLFSIAMKKAAYGIAKAMLALATASKAMAIEKKLGISIDAAAFEAGAASLAVAGFTLIHDWMKLKFPDIKWL